MRRLSPDEQALWDRVVASVRPLRLAPPSDHTPPVAASVPAPAPVKPRVRGQAVPPRPVAAASPRPAMPANTLDGSWDRRLGRGLIQPDLTVDLHGHNLATAYDLLDDRLERAVATGARVMLLVTGKPPAGGRIPVGRGAIRAAVGDWLAASRHASSIAAVRGAHPRHGGLGALYIVLRRAR